MKWLPLIRFKFHPYSFKDFCKLLSGNGFQMANSNKVECSPIDEGSISTDKQPSTAS